MVVFWIMHYLQQAFAPEYFSNWVLTLFAVITAIVAIRTLRSINEQAKSGREAAEAALLNAQAVINIERPWIFATVKKGNAQPTDENPEGAVQFKVHIENKGRTPAEIISYTDMPDVILGWDEREIP